MQSTAARRRSVRCRPRNASPPLPQSCFVICNLTTSRRIRARPVAPMRGTPFAISISARHCRTGRRRDAIIANGYRRWTGSRRSSTHIGRQS